jgi:hypothetical protein
MSIKEQENLKSFILSYLSIEISSAIKIIPTIKIKDNEILRSKLPIESKTYNTSKALLIKHKIITESGGGATK